jgi:excisionase family DNA binding protein
MGLPDYVSIAEAAALTGVHPVTLRRLIRQRVLRALRDPVDGRRRWLVSTRSLRDYFHPVTGFALEQYGPKLFLKRAHWDDS